MAQLKQSTDTRHRGGETTRELWFYVALAFGISWVVGVAGSLVLGPAAYLIGVFGPGIAALWASRRFQGSTSQIWSQLTRWRVAPGWYVLVVSLPLGLVGLAYLAVRGGGGDWVVEDPLTAPAAIGFFVFAVVVAGGPEELGWRGYALPRLQDRTSALGASLIVGVLWAIWHLPLWFMPDLAFADLSYPLYALQAIAMCVIYTWVYNATRGSLLLAVLLHASGNVASLYLATSVVPQAALVGGWVLVAAAVIARHGAADLSRSPRVRRADVLPAP